MEKGDPKFRLNNKEVTFNVCRTMKHPIDIKVVSIINSLDNSSRSRAPLGFELKAPPDTPTGGDLTSDT